MTKYGLLIKNGSGRQIRLHLSGFFLSLAVRSAILMDEKTLVALLKKDDPSAIRTIFDRYHTSLCRLVYRISRDEDQSKDIVQDVFIKLWRNRQQLEITGSLEAYLKRAAVNTALN